RRHREQQKEKRRRHQELFAEQKKRKLLPEAVLQELQELQELQDVPARAPMGTLVKRPSASLKHEQTRQSFPKEKKYLRKNLKDLHLSLTRTKGNYMAVCLKEHSGTGLHQQLAKDFLNAQLYGPHTNRVQANEFFSLANKKDPVKKAAVQFVDKSWGQDKKEKAARFKKRWLA
ncbi:NOL7 protein, partial [Polioptila caerulea]|nr:NOL7 protein [Polioptila caerulea]